MQRHRFSDENVTPLKPRNQAAPRKIDGLTLAMARARQTNPDLAPLPNGYDNVEAFPPEVNSDAMHAEPVAVVTFRSTRRAD